MIVDREPWSFYVTEQHREGTELHRDFLSGPLCLIGEINYPGHPDSKDARRMTDHGIDVFAVDFSGQR